MILLNCYLEYVSPVGQCLLIAIFRVIDHYLFVFVGEEKHSNLALHITFRFYDGYVYFLDPAG